MNPINLKEKHVSFTKQWHPHQIATVDDMLEVLLFEKQQTAHTGNVQHEKTQNNYPKI